MSRLPGAQTTDPTTPVIVVGGGPTGLCVALELDHHGVPVTVIEPRTRVEHQRPRAKTTSARTMELLRRWGLADRLRAAAPLPVGWSQRVAFVENVLGDELAHLDGCLGLATPAELSAETAQQVGQGIVEEVLRSAVAERPGIVTRFGWSVESVRRRTDGVDVVALDESGRRVGLAAPWVVGADGPRSVVRSAMDVRYEGAAGGRPNVNITFRAPGLAARIPHPPSIHYWVLDPRAPGVVGPVDLDGTWWAISTGTERIDSDAEAIAIVRGLIGARIDVEIVATDPWQARMLLASDYRDGRLFLVGDAAHQNPPWGGHGYNTGVGDAVNLGWKLAAVIAGWAPEALLDSYGRERRPVAQQTIELARSNMAALSVDLSADPDLSAARVRRLKSPEFYADGLVLGYGYTPAASRQAPRSQRYRPRLEPGNRLPHRVVDGVALVDLLGRGFTLVGPPGSPATGLLAAARRHGVPVRHVPSTGELVLVRPDQHVAWVGAEAADPDRIWAAALVGFPGAAID